MYDKMLADKKKSYAFMENWFAGKLDCINQNFFIFFFEDSLSRLSRRLYSVVL